MTTSDEPLDISSLFKGSTSSSEALDFLQLCRSEAGGGAASPGRIATVLLELQSRGYYKHTIAELQFGAKLAWRNTLDCIGKVHWSTLQVNDARNASTFDEMYEALIDHLRLATNDGKIRLLLTALKPQLPGRAGWRILNSQLIQYAGYLNADGSALGDRATIEFTSLARNLGWSGNGTRFDVLPLVLKSPNGVLRWYEIPRDAVMEVPLSHPSLHWFSDLGLRWYAHPAISNQLMRIGGISYPAVTFSGWYTATEIGARNLSDTSRYNMLPTIASRMGLDMTSPRTLWRDRAQVELISAVLHSYEQQGVTIVDHHFTAASFVRFEQREKAAGRPVAARWRSLIAPTAASTTPVFGRIYPETVELPNFFPHPYEKQ